MNFSVGPLIARPATNGLTATTGAGLATTASRIPGTARIGPMLITGFEGPITIVARPRAPRLPPRRRGGLDALELDRLDRRIGAVEDQILLEAAPPLRVRTRVRTG